MAIRDPLSSIKDDHHNADFYLWEDPRGVVYALYPIQEDILLEFQRRGVHLGSPILFSESGEINISGRTHNILTEAEAAALIKHFSKTKAHDWAKVILAKVNTMKFPYKSHYMNDSYIGKEGYFLEKKFVIKNVKPALNSVHDRRHPPAWQFWRQSA